MVTEVTSTPDFVRLALNENQITPDELKSILDYSKFSSRLLSAYPRKPEGFDDIPNSISPILPFYDDWDVSHYLNGLLGEIHELCTVQFNVPEEKPLAFLVPEAIKELGDIMFYLTGLINKTPGLFDFLEAYRVHHEIQFPEFNKFENLNDAILYFSEKVTNLYKRHLYYGDPKEIQDIDLPNLARHTITLLRCIKTYGDSVLSIADTFIRLDTNKYLPIDILSSISQARELAASSPSLFAQPRGLITILAANRTKLEKRYPTGTFTLQDAIERKDVE